MTTSLTPDLSQPLPATALEALVHMTPDGQTALGVWVDRSGTWETHYALPDDDPDVEYGYALVAERTAMEAFDHLPSVTPYIAYWDVIERQPNETALAVYTRIGQS